MLNMKLFLKSFCVFTLVSLLVIGCKLGQKTDFFPDNTINVGFISYPPGFIVDPNTKEKSGIFNDVIVEIAKRNNLTINYKMEVTWATLIEVLILDRVDLIASPVWATPERKENADFSIPLYFSPVGIYVRADDDRFDDDVNKINAPYVKIAAIDGEINYHVAKADFPQAVVISLPNNVDAMQLFLEIQSNRADVTFVEPMFAYAYMQKNPGKLKNIGEKTPIRNYPNSIMYKQGNEKLGRFINEEIQKLLIDGALDEIIKKYEPFEGAVISATDSRAIDKQ